MSCRGGRKGACEVSDPIYLLIFRILQVANLPLALRGQFAVFAVPGVGAVRARPGVRSGTLDRLNDAVRFCGGERRCAARVVLLTPLPPLHLGLLQERQALLRESKVVELELIHGVVLVAGSFDAPRLARRRRA